MVTLSSCHTHNTHTHTHTHTHTNKQTHTQTNKHTSLCPDGSLMSTVLILEYPHIINAGERREGESVDLNIQSPLQHL